MLEELQSLSETKKKQVIIIATIIIMIIVVGAWAVYFNGVIMGSAQQSVAQATSTSVTPTATPAAVAPATTPAPSGPSLWQHIENGFGFIVNIFKKPWQYNIQPQ